MNLPEEKDKSDNSIDPLDRFRKLTQSSEDEEFETRFDNNDKTEIDSGTKTENDELHDDTSETNEFNHHPTGQPDATAGWFAEDLDELK